jgi:site-specific recombinase XerD
VARGAGITTGRSRRHRHALPEPELGFNSRFVAGPLQPAPAKATTPPRPFGTLTSAPTDRIIEVARQAWTTGRATTRERVTGVRFILDHLGGFVGDNWQQRWQASGLDGGQLRAGEVCDQAISPYSALTGVRVLFCLRIVQPSLVGFRAHRFTQYPEVFHAVQHDPLLDAYFDAVAAHEVGWKHKREALFDVCCLLTVQGITLADLTPQAMLYHAHESRRLGVTFHSDQRSSRFAGLTAWNILHRMGLLPASVPSTMRAALHRGQRSVEELVGRYPIRNQAIGRLLVDYLLRRRVDSDYASVDNLARILAHLFWEKIEQLNPDQADLRLSPDLYAAWREAICLRDDGTPRSKQDDIVLAVRSFYLDLHTWAAAEPERWAAWVAPCPVPPTDIRGLGTRRRRINERTADRIRQRQPLLPALVAHVEQRYETAQALLARAQTTAPNDQFTLDLDGHVYRRLFGDRERKAARHQPPAVRVLDQTIGKTIHATRLEEAAFWDWAVVETLRHTGVRVEELCELTHLSVRQYQRPSGEVVALLVIAPSKTDRERVIPISAELFHVIATIIRRHTHSGRTIPLVSRFDPHDKVWSPSLPFLFQRQIGSSRAVISPATVLNMLRRRCAELAEHNPAFCGIRFTPHDFRRLFATELVNNGLPIHIGAALLGHLDVGTTRGYVAIFQEDLIRHYQTHLDQRRRARPQDEYRPATPEEWTEFEEHFDKRKVELGSCGRPYGTPCQHEHACIRCPMLHVNPKMLPRLNELEADLLARRAHAEAKGWLGELEGIDLTLSFLRDKRDQAQRLIRSNPALGPVHLGMPLTRGADR